MKAKLVRAPLGNNDCRSIEIAYAEAVANPAVAIAAVDDANQTVGAQLFSRWAEDDSLRKRCRNDFHTKIQNKKSVSDKYTFPTLPSLVFHSVFFFQDNPQ